MENPKKVPLPMQIGSGISGTMAILMACPTIMIIYHRLGFGDSIGLPRWAEMPLLLPLAATIGFAALSVFCSRPWCLHRKDPADNERIQADG